MLIFGSQTLVASISRKNINSPDEAMKRLLDTRTARERPAHMVAAENWSWSVSSDSVLAFVAVVAVLKEEWRCKNWTGWKIDEACKWNKRSG